jgi:hypothetical protein
MNEICTIVETGFLLYSWLFYSVLFAVCTCMYVCMFKTICGLLFLSLLTTPNVSIKVKLIFVMTLTVLNMIKSKHRFIF